MKQRYLLGAALVFFIFFQGCTVIFKGKDVELEIERQRVEYNRAYELELIKLFDE